MKYNRNLSGLNLRHNPYNLLKYCYPELPLPLAGSDLVPGSQC